MARPKRLPTVLSQSETEALRGAIRTRSITGLRNRAMVESMLGAGLRVSEVVALRPTDVDLEEGTVRVNRGKGAKDRVVPIDDDTTAWLQAWAEKRAARGLNSRQRFFCGIRKLGTPLAIRTVQGSIKRLANRAGIEKNVTPHTLRHTYATSMLRRGLSLRDVQTLLGHASVATTEIYLHVDPEDLREKVQGHRPEADPVVQELAKQLAELPEEARKALAELLG